MNCKPGDLAFLRATARMYPENIGKVVRVIAPCSFPSQPHLDWRIESEGTPLRTMRGSERVGYCCDSALCPIRPEPELLPAPPVAVTA